MNNDEKFNKMLKAFAPDLAEINNLLKETEMDSVTLIKYLNLIKNVRIVTGWGKVTTLIQNTDIVMVEQEQGYKIDK